MKLWKDRKWNKITEFTLKIFFVDAILGYERLVSFLSALIWAWIEFGFLKFFLSMLFAISSFAGSDSIQFMIDAIKAHPNWLYNFIYLYVFIQFVLRLRVRKEIKK